jgi:hypothetical protein
LSIGIYNNRHSRKLYRNNKRRRPYRKQWVRKKALDKKGFTRYSTGPKWSGQYFAEKPAFWRTHQVNWTEKYRDKCELLSNGYSVHENWIALCKSWNGFLLAKREGNHENMKQYAMQIRSIQKALGLPQTQFDMFTPEEMEWMERESDDTVNEFRYARTLDAAAAIA